MYNEESKDFNSVLLNYCLGNYFLLKSVDFLSTKYSNIYYILIQYAHGLTVYKACESIDRDMEFGIPKVFVVKGFVL